MTTPTIIERAARVKEMVSLSDVVRRSVALSRAGRELVGQCPFHDDRTPSLSVSDEKGLFHCFGCHASGDVITYTMLIEGLDFVDAVELLEHGELPAALPPMRLPSVEREPFDRQLLARRIWESAVEELQDTPVQAYLLSRGLYLEMLRDTSSLRYATLAYPGQEGLHPVLVAAVRNEQGDVVGVQRTFLQPDGRKLDVDKPKLSLGSIKGNFIQIGEPTEEMMICEGLEDGLTLSASYSNGIRVAAGANMLSAIPVGPQCRRILIAADNDLAGQTAARSAARHHRARGRMALILRPWLQFKDFNEEYLHHLGAYWKQVDADTEAEDAA